jgi:exopolysaccharide biosynthesis predicted pyruvyltransferase EpsI
MTSIEQIQMEAEQAFDWLTDGVPRDSAVTFVPNPGNVGDAAINLACWRHLRSKFTTVAVCAAGDRPTADHIFIGGGGNLVEPLYQEIAGVLRGLAPRQRVFVFPSTIYGYPDLLDAIADRARIVCREDVSYHFVRKHLPAANVRLGHDAAFALSRHLRAEFAHKISQHPRHEAALFRSDRERGIENEIGFDLMGQYNSDWLDLKLADTVTALAAKYLLGFGRVQTDRLHCAILSAILDRETVLYPNSYFKNAAVFKHSLSRLPNVAFEANWPVQSDANNNPALFRQSQNAMNT